MKIWSLTFVLLVLVFATKRFAKKRFSTESCHISKYEKVGSTGVLSGEHMVHVVVAGLDKVPISMQCYSASRSPALRQGGLEDTGFF